MTSFILINIEDLIDVMDPGRKLEQSTHNVIENTDIHPLQNINQIDLGKNKIASNN